MASRMVILLLSTWLLFVSMGSESAPHAEAADASCDGEASPAFLLQKDVRRNGKSTLPQELTKSHHSWSPEQVHLSEPWSLGEVSWQAARKATEAETLWDVPNSCDPRVLQTSAPLTVLFGLSTIWERIQQRRKEDGRAGKPLEIHLLGAAYPFEGRSDWALLANRRPADVPSVRVVLVLGTPFQSDNVPPLANQPETLLQLSRNSTPIAGRWSDKRDNIICEGQGRWGTDDMDQKWSKESLCRDHGNGLEVVCLEKFYQDVRTELPHPDLAVMFSPGFPQLARRSWDAVLIGLLNDKVFMMLSDVILLPQWGHGLNMTTHAKFGSQPVLPGDRWYPAARIGEDWQTWLAMTKYGARKVKARRNPFPILHREEGEVLAKNGVVQIYQGYMPKRQPTQPLTADAISNYTKQYNQVNWHINNKACSEGQISEMKKIFSVPTSRPFQSAQKDLHKDSFSRTVKSKMKRPDYFTDTQLARLKEYGLVEEGSGERPKRSKPWGLKAWIYIFKTLGCRDEF